MTENHDSDWQRKTFADLFDIRIGGTPSRSKPEYWATKEQDGAPWASIADMRQPVINGTKERITPEGILRSNVKLLPKDTVLMSFKLTLGRISLAGVPLYTNEAIAGFLPKTEEVLSEFVLYALSAVDLSAELDMAVKGQTLNKEKLGRLTLKYPKPTYQKKIASILREATKALTTSEDLITQLQKLKRVVMRKLLTSGIPGRHDEFRTTDLGSIPLSWSIQALEDIGIWGGGGTPSKSKAEYWTNDGLPWISPKDMRDSEIFDAEDHITALGVRESSTNVYPEGTILIVARSGILRNTLPIAITRRVVSINQDMKALLPLEGMSPDFIYQMLEYHAPEILKSCVKFGTTVESLQTASLYAYRVAMPPISEQNEIVEILVNFDERIRVEQARSRQLARVKDALAQQLLTGRLPVPDVEEVVAT